MSFLENNFFLLAITFGIFFFAKLLQKKTGLVLLNPILLTIALLIIFLKMTNISYETYNKGGHLIEFWLRPAVVALGVPLYLQLEMIKKQLLPILLSQLAGCIVGVISVVLIAKLMGASQEVILSLAPKSVTTPIAMEVTKAIGGDCVYITVYIVETVVKIRPVNAFRQVCFNIVYNIAQFQPVAAYLISWNMLFKVNVNNALPRARITCNVINIRQCLGFFFNFICNLHFHFFGCCAGPCSRYNHLLNRIYRVFRAAENVIGINAGNKAKKHEKINYLFMFNRP